GLERCIPLAHVALYGVVSVWMDFLHDDRGMFFFFQAEDGIRDPLVTGVQTCALPIFGWCSDATVFSYRCFPSAFADFCGNGHDRSEERRVGKECRSRWSRYD